MAFNLFVNITLKAFFIRKMPFGNANDNKPFMLKGIQFAFRANADYDLFEQMLPE